MGNHEAGRAAVAVAVAILNRRTNETALEILDEAFGPLRDYTRPDSGCDAEFDDDLWPDTKVGVLLIEAFAPGETFDRDEGEDRFYRRVITPFRARYNLW